MGGGGGEWKNGLFLTAIIVALLKLQQCGFFSVSFNSFALFNLTHDLRFTSSYVKL